MRTRLGARSPPVPADGAFSASSASILPGKPPPRPRAMPRRRSGELDLNVNPNQMLDRRGRGGAVAHWHWAGSAGSWTRTLTRCRSDDDDVDARSHRRRPAGVPPLPLPSRGSPAARPPAIAASSSSRVLSLKCSFKKGGQTPYLNGVWIKYLHSWTKALELRTVVACNLTPILF